MNTHTAVGVFGIDVPILKLLVAKEELAIVMCKFLWSLA